MHALAIKNIIIINAISDYRAHSKKQEHNAKYNTTPNNIPVCSIMLSEIWVVIRRSLFLQSVKCGRIGPAVGVTAEDGSPAQQRNQLQRIIQRLYVSSVIAV